jgi:RNA polymerase sigma-70 factor (ECF subfamily)
LAVERNGDIKKNTCLQMKNELLKNWVTSYTDELFKWAYHKTSSTETAEDLVQETFLAATEKMKSFKGDSSVRTWLFSILNHKIIDHYRKNVNQPVSTDNQFFSTFFDEEGSWKMERKPLDWHDEDKHILDDEGFREVLKRCLDALPPQWSTSVKLKYLMSKNGDEICQELGIAPTNLWQIIHRAKLQLRDCVNSNWFKN